MGRGLPIDRLAAELAALYEISSLGLAEDLEGLLKEAQEKAVRIFGLSHYALLVRDHEGKETFTCWGFRGMGEIPSYLERFGGTKALVFPFRRDGVSGQLVMGKDRPIEPEDRRLFSIFAHYLEAALVHLCNLRRLRQTEERLRAEMELARGVLATIPDCILVIDHQMRVKGANHAFFYTFAREPKEVVGRTLQEVLGDGEEALKVLFLKGRNLPAGLEVNLRTAKGTRLFVVLARPMVDPRGEGRELLILRDITEEREAQRALSRYQESLRQAFLGTAEALIKVIEQRDPYTSGHCGGVARLARAIGEELGLPEDKLTGLYVCGVLHDIGKISIPADILVRPGRLGELEMDLIRLHPKAGYEILKDIAFPWPVASVALQHHERLDGSGYPQGLKGDEIAPEARIVAVADVVDAEIHNRPYRPALGIEEALEEIERNKGVKYDPEVVEACVKCLERGNLTF